MRPNPGGALMVVPESARLPTAVKARPPPTPHNGAGLAHEPPPGMALIRARPVDAWPEGMKAFARSQYFCPATMSMHCVATTWGLAAVLLTLSARSDPELGDSAASR